MPSWEMLKSVGYTDFEINSLKDATRFLGSTFLSLAYRYGKTKQLQELLNPDNMDDGTWALYLEQNWQGLELNESVN